MLTSADLVALLERTTDKDGWLTPTLADPDGGAALGAVIAIMARAAAAVSYDSKTSSISDAPGGSPGTTTLVLARGTSGTSGTIPTGYLFRDPRGIQLRVVAPVTVASGALTISVALATLRQTEIVNTNDDPGLAVDPASGVLLDSLGTTALLAPPGDPSIVATTFLPGTADLILGGTSDWLSVIGRERSQQRQAGESTESYRARVRTIPDAVSPIAVADAVIGAASRVGVSAMVLEPFDDGASAALRTMHGLGFFTPLAWSSTNYQGTAAAAAASPGTDFFDDSGAEREVIDRRSATAYFRVVLAGPLADFANETFWYDDGFWDDPVRGYLDVGTPPSVNAQGNAIWEEANRKRAGGVAFDVELDAAVVERGSGHTTAAAPTTVFTLTAPSGKAWMLVDAIAGHDGALNAFPPGLLVPSTAYHRLTFTFVGGGTYTTPIHHGLASERFTPDRMSALGAPRAPITQVQGVVFSDGTAIVNLVLALRVLEMVLP